MRKPLATYNGPPARRAPSAMSGVLGETGRISFAELHPDTDPAVIWRRQCDDVYHAVVVLDTRDVDVLSDWLILPCWSIRRALAELGIEPTTQPTARVKKPVLTDRLREAMADGKWHTADDLGKQTGAQPGSVAWYMSHAKGVYEFEWRPNPATGRANKYWRLKSAEVADDATPG